MVEKLLDELSSVEQVEAIALGGSRAGTVYDENSDYDVYLYCTVPIREDIRSEILSRYCSTMEIGNHFWEYEDNCTLKDGVDIDILYRSLDELTHPGKKRLVSLCRQQCRILPERFEENLDQLFGDMFTDPIRCAQMTNRLADELEKRIQGSASAIISTIPPIPYQPETAWIGSALCLSWIISMMLMRRMERYASTNSMTIITTAKISGISSACGLSIRRISSVSTMSRRKTCQIP